MENPKPVSENPSPSVNKTPDIPMPQEASQPSPFKPEAQTQVSPASVTTIEHKKGGRGFGIFVTFGIIVILCIYGYVGFLYLSNQKLKGSSQKNSSGSPESSTTPTPTFNRDFVKVSEGNVVYDDGSSGSKILVDKHNFTGTGITGFIKVSVSPDNTKMCFEAWPPAPTPALYVASVDGTSVSQVSEKRKNCLWTNDSKKILYVNIPSPGTYSNVFLYDTEAKEESNLTDLKDGTKVTKNFDLVGLSADGTKAICKYEDPIQEEAGQCEIDLANFEINYL